MYFETSSDIWKDLEVRFGNPSSSQIYRLQEQLITDFQEPNMNIVDYFTRVKSLWDEIDDLRHLPVCTCIPTAIFGNFNEIKKS